SQFELISVYNLSEGIEFDTLVLPTLNGPKYFDITYEDTGVYATVAVPLPASIWLFMSGLSLFGLRKKIRIN
ncbi:MAG: hypothetical protein ACR2QG_01035, partial [Gammaproteobacteria bacterium]